MEQLSFDFSALALPGPGAWALPESWPVRDVAGIAREIDHVQAALDAGAPIDFEDFDTLCALWANGRYGAHYTAPAEVARYDALYPTLDAVIERVIALEEHAHG